MTDIELRNENGKIVGYDLDTGEKVPVSYEDLEADSADISGTTTTGALETDQATIGELAAVAELTTDQSISDSTITTVAFDSASFEHSSIVDVDTSTGVITVQKDGGYLIGGLLGWNSDADWTDGDEARYYIEAGGTIASEDDNRKTGTGTEARACPMRMVDLTAQDTIKAEVLQGAGAPVPVQGSPARTYLTVLRLGA